ncbi:MAG: homoserine O-acetyltransferase [Polaribacter sp.]
MNCPFFEHKANFNPVPKKNSDCSFYQFKETFSLENGGQIAEPVIAYHTYGTLNESRDNVIYICHALTANSDAEDWWHGLFGKGDIFDWDKYFIICANNLGSPYGSSSPKQIDPNSGEKYGMDFPFFTLRDTAKLHIKLLEYLKISSIKLLIGGSGGGNICQELAYLWNDQVKNMALLCCSAKETPWVIGIHESQRIVLRTDPTLGKKMKDAGAAGLKACRAAALPFYRTHASFKVRQHEHDLNKMSDFRASSYINYQGDKFVKRFDPHCYYHLLNALDTHNMGRGRKGIEKALSEIKANTIVIGFDSDLLIPKVEQQFISRHIPNATYVEIKTLFGHDGFLIETDDISRSIRNVLSL